MKNNWTEVVQAIGSILSGLISLVGFLFVWRQIRQTNKNLRQSNHTAIYSINTEIYKFFAEHSDLRPYFHENKPLTLIDQNRNRVFSLSELLADFFEYILVEKDSLASEIKQPWRNYIKKIYNNSPGFREFLELNKDQYSGELLSVFSEIDINKIAEPVFTQVVKTKAEFVEVDSIYQSCFLDYSVPTEVQRNWWRTYPNGIIALFEGKHIIGGLSYWPIDTETFELLLRGEIRERDIQPNSIEIVNPQCYYLSEIAITKVLQGKGYSGVLLMAFLNALANSQTSDSEQKVLALGFSRMGDRVLQNIGFKLVAAADKMPDKQRLYLLSLKSKNQIEVLKSRIC